MTLRAKIKSMLPGPLRRVLAHRRFWRAYRWAGEWELRELPGIVDPARGAVDVGGNSGVYTFHLSRLAAWVRAFEPNPDLADELAALRRPNVTIERVALSDAAGQAELRIPRAGAGENTGMASLEAEAVGDMARALPVELRTLDSYRLTGLGFVKIDVEGHEEAVVKGALETIRANRPALLIEIEERHNAGGLERIAALLGAERYDGFFFQDGRRRPLAEFRADTHQVVSDALSADSYRSRRELPYINNFLFLPRDA